MSQSECCGQEEEMCSISQGDTIPFEFEFLQPDTSPMPLAGKILDLYMTPEGDVMGAPFFSVTFPDTASSAKGKGAMRLLPVDTGKLVPGTTYNFKFKLVNGPSEVFTVGRGTVPVV